jgi:small-conductance mechanosensitive channel
MGVRNSRSAGGLTQVRIGATLPKVKLLGRLRGPVLLAAGALAFGAAVRAFKASHDFPEILRTAHKIPLVLSVAWGLGRVVGVLFELGMERNPRWRNSGAIQLLRGSFVLLIWATAGLLVLETVGISVTPILASLGVGSLAVALAAQDTLGNFFSGLYLQLDEPARLGDRVRLETGHEGWVREIGWRSTRIELLTGETLFVPNTKLASSLLRNFSMAESGRMKSNLEVVLPQRGRPISDLRQEISRATGVAEVAAQQLVGSAVVWGLTLEAESPLALARLKHDTICRLDEWMRAEGIQALDHPRSVSN